MHEIKIFIASSEELKHERLIFPQLANNLNILLKEKQIKIELEKWEYLDSSMGVKHKQAEYNDVLQECEMCIALFWTKFGDYTKEELELSLKEVDTTHIYFKEADVSISEELLQFKEYCKQSSMSCHDFVDDNMLRYLIITHIDAYCQKHFDTPIARIENSQLMVEHKSFVDLNEIAKNA